MRTLTWTENLAYLRKLWPAWNPINEHAELWAESLESRNQYEVRTAIKTHFGQSGWKEPKLNKILDVLNKRREARSGAPDHRQVYPLHEILRRRWSKEKPEWAAAYARMGEHDILALEAKYHFDRKFEFYGALSIDACEAYWLWQAQCMGAGTRTEPLGFGMRAYIGEMWLLIVDAGKEREAQQILGQTAVPEPHHAAVP